MPENYHLQGRPLLERENGQEDGPSELDIRECTQKLMDERSKRTQIMANRFAGDLQR